MSNVKQIDEIWAWVSVDPEDNTEGVCAVFYNDRWLPLIASDKARLDSIRADALFLHNETGMTLKLIKLSVREEIETLERIPEAEPKQTTND